MAEQEHDVLSRRNQLSLEVEHGGVTALVDVVGELYQLRCSLWHLAHPGGHLLKRGRYAEGRDNIPQRIYELVSSKIPTYLQEQ